MRSALLQGAGQPDASILPNWMSGYGLTFSSDANLDGARRERAQVRTAPNWTVGYDANDSVARLLVERIALNAKDAGLALQPTSLATADLRLVRIPLETANPWIALSKAVSVLGMAMPKRSGDGVEDLYSAERELLAGQRVIPLFHLPTEWASSPALRDWRPGADGGWRFDDCWMTKD